VKPLQPIGVVLGETWYALHNLLYYGQTGFFSVSEIGHNASLIGQVFFCLSQSLKKTTKRGRQSVSFS